MKNKPPDLEEETRKIELFQVSLANDKLGFVISREQLERFKGFKKSTWVRFDDIKGRECIVQRIHIVAFYKLDN